MKKLFISADALLEDSMALAKAIYDDNFLPDIIVGVWRGGAPIAISMHEYFCYRGFPCDHIAVRARSYGEDNLQRTHIDIDGLEYLLKNMRPEHKLLIVDDVFDSGRSIEALIRTLTDHAGSAMPAALKIACAWYKPGNALTTHAPDYYLHTTSQWLVFPHELMSLSADDIKHGKGSQIYSLLCGNQDD